MLTHDIPSRLIIFIFIPMHTHVSTVLMIRQSLEPSPTVTVDSDFCYSVRYYTNFLGEINCSSDCTVYNYQDHGLIRYSPEQGWQFMDKPFVCMCSCNFDTKELRNGYVIGNSIVSHESLLNYTCHPGFKKTTSSRIICLDGIFVSVESADSVELPESVNENSTIFRKYPLSNKDFSKLSNSVYEFLIDSDSWICNNYHAQKEFAYKVYNSRVPYKLLSDQEETCYKDGHIDISRRTEIGCIKEITYPLTPVDSVHQNITHIFSVSIFGFVIVIFFAVGIVTLYLARRKVSKALQKRSVRECDPQFLNGQQESASTSSGGFCFVAVSVNSRNKCSTHLTGSGELYVNENKHLFYSKSGQCRIACLLTPKVLRKNLSSDDFSWTLHSRYLEDDSDGDENLPEGSERSQCLNMTENINSWSRHISKRSKSESDISKKDLQSRNLNKRSHSDYIMPVLKNGSASAYTAMEENNAGVINEDQKEESIAQSEMINESVQVSMVVMNERTNLDDDSQSDKEHVNLHREDNDERETTPLMAEANDMQHNGSSFSGSLTGSGELYVTENKHLFYSKRGKCRIACLLTPKVLRKNLSSDDFSWTLHSKYLEDDTDGDKNLPEDLERSVNVHREDNDERETTPLMAVTNDMKHNDSYVSMLEMSLTEDCKRELQNSNSCTLYPNNAKSDMTLGHLSSRKMDPDSLRCKSDPYIF